MISNLVVSEKAEADLQNILFYTQQQWGAAQREKYAYMFDQAFKRLMQNKDMDIKSAGRTANFRRVRAERHFIFYRIDKKNIHIVRILHERMDFQRHLK
jgi:toxin ParE1/3/4